MSVTVRPLAAKDQARWRTLWDGYLTFYECPDLDPKTTDHTWDMLTDPREDVFGLVAERDGEVVGFVHGVVHANTWLVQPICYLEDLFVDPAWRGQGTGRALIEALVGRAKASGWAQVYWRTAETNPARKLYDQVADKIDFVTYVRKVSGKSST
ncbi:MAG TPA: GNAT family N-acetyltransferase [Magnetovibrio sp.]